MCTMPTGLPPSTTNSTVNGTLVHVHHGQRFTHQAIRSNGLGVPFVITSATLWESRSPAR